MGQDVCSPGHTAESYCSVSAQDIKFWDHVLVLSSLTSWLVVLCCPLACSGRSPRLPRGSVMSSAGHKSWICPLLSCVTLSAVLSVHVHPDQHLVVVMLLISFCVAVRPSGQCPVVEALCRGRSPGCQCSGELWAPLTERTNTNKCKYWQSAPEIGR